MDLKRLYEYRFRDVDQTKRQAVWGEIAAFLFDHMGRPGRVLDPAAGRCEFINAVLAEERWAVDEISHGEDTVDPGVKMNTSEIMQADLPDAHFYGIFVSNFLEHLTSQEAVAAFLAKMHEFMAPGGIIAIMGLSFRYCAREYFDIADQTVILTYFAVAEHLYAAGLRSTR